MTLIPAATTIVAVTLIQADKNYGEPEILIILNVQRSGKCVMTVASSNQVCEWPRLDAANDGLCTQQIKQKIVSAACLLR